MNLDLVFVSAYYPPYSVGGAEHSTVALAKALTDRGHRVHLVAPRLGARRPETGVPTTTVDVGLSMAERGSALPQRIFNRPDVQLGLARAVRGAARDADVVHCQTLHTLPAAYVGARLGRSPVVTTLRDLSGICPVCVCLLENDRVPSDCGVAKLERECLPRARELYGGPGRTRHAIAALLHYGTARGRSALARRCDGVFAVGTDLGTLYREAGLLRETPPVLPNVATVERHDRSTLDLGAGMFGVFAGRVSPGKGAQYLIDAVQIARRHAPGLQITVAGYADRRWAAQLEAADGIHYVGVLTGGELSSVYQQAAFAVVPSIAPEPLPRAALEAAAHGLAVVGTAVGGIPDAVKHARTGLLVPPRDSTSLAEAMLTLWHDPSLRARLGHAGRRHMAERFGASIIATRAEELYASVVDKFRSGDRGRGLEC